MPGGQRLLVALEPVHGAAPQGLDAPQDDRRCLLRARGQPSGTGREGPAGDVRRVAQVADMAELIDLNEISATNEVEAALKPRLKPKPLGVGS